MSKRMDVWSYTHFEVLGACADWFTIECMTIPDWQNHLFHVYAELNWWITISPPPDTPTGDYGAIMHTWMDWGQSISCGFGFHVTGPIVYAEAGGPYEGLEGEPVLFDASGTFSDPAYGDPMYSWDWDNDGMYDESSASPTATHTWYDDYQGIVGLKVEVPSGHSSTDTADITIQNQRPWITMAPDRISWEGTREAYLVSGWDPGLLDTHTFTWDFGDGSPPQTGTNIGHLSAAHTYGDNGEYWATLTVEDDDGGIADSRVLTVVFNVDPVVSIDQVTPHDTVFVGDEVEFFGSFTDPGFLDTHTIEWDFGDDTQDSGSLITAHAYQSSGLFTATLTVEDDDGGIGVDTVSVEVVTPAEATEDLAETVDGMIDESWEQSLLHVLQQAQASLENGRDRAALRQLEAFIRMVEARRGRGLSDREADFLIAEVQKIVQHI